MDLIREETESHKICFGFSNREDSTIQFAQEPESSENIKGVKVVGMCLWADDDQITGIETQYSNRTGVMLGSESKHTKVWK